MKKLVLVALLPFAVAACDKPADDTVAEEEVVAVEETPAADMTAETPAADMTAETPAPEATETPAPEATETPM